MLAFSFLFLDEEEKSLSDAWKECSLSHSDASNSHVVVVVLLFLQDVQDEMNDSALYAGEY